MNKKLIYVIVGVLIVAGVGFGIYRSSSSSGQSQSLGADAAAALNAPDATTSSDTTSTASSMTKLSDEPYAQFAHEIDPTKLNNLDSTMKQVLSGFDVTMKSNADGSVTIELKATNPEYQDQSYTLKTGQKLYFIEKNLKDDAVTEDHFYGDDTAVVVDQNGYVVSQ